MRITVDERNGSRAAVVESPDIVIHEAQDALDLMATIHYNENCSKIVLEKHQLADAFFELRSGLAGDILQKFTNYRMKLAIVGDFGEYDSKSLKDFIYECNRGRQFFFAADREAALRALHGAG